MDDRCKGFTSVVKNDAQQFKAILSTKKVAISFFDSKIHFARLYKDNRLNNTRLPLQFLAVTAFFRYT